MALPLLPTVTLSPAAFFPQKYFLENLAVRADESILITAVLQKELWWVPPAKPGAVVDPVLVYSFDHPVTGIAEVAPDVFIVSLSEGYTTHESHLVRIDFIGWTPGAPVSPEVIFTFDDRVRALNGSCLLGPNVLAVADCFAGLIWRVDLADDARSATARVWLADDTMASIPTAACLRRRSLASTAFATGQRPATSTTPRPRRKYSCALPSIHPVLIRPDRHNSSPPSTTPTTSASTRTPDSPTSQGIAPTPSIVFRWRPGAAAKYATSPAIRSMRPSLGRPAPRGDVARLTTDASPT